MGCLDETDKFNHWFGNIHLSGPCNRSCYFCIGQHMMALDPFNNLDEWPLKNFDAFIKNCQKRGVKEVNLTGSNTEPLLYRHHSELCGALRDVIPEVQLGIRTNGALILDRIEQWAEYDRASISVTSFDHDIYRATMGSGSPPDIQQILRLKPKMYVYINIVLCPELLVGGDIYNTFNRLADAGVKYVNLREPYGQPHVGNPMSSPVGTRFGMPIYDWRGMSVMYWDVHRVEVESVNLYANGIVNETYSVTKGHDPSGNVLSQEHWTRSGRHQEQWLKY